MGGPGKRKRPRPPRVGFCDPKAACRTRHGIGRRSIPRPSKSASAMPTAWASWAGGRMAAEGMNLPATPWLLPATAVVGGGARGRRLSVDRSAVASGAARLRGPAFAGARSRPAERSGRWLRGRLRRVGQHLERVALSLDLSKNRSRSHGGLRRPRRDPRFSAGAASWAGPPGLRPRWAGCGGDAGSRCSMGGRAKGVGLHT
jgi:hypothetical protein